MIQMQLTFKMISRFKFKHRGILFFKAVHFLLIRVYEFKFKSLWTKEKKDFHWLINLNYKQKTMN